MSNRDIIHDYLKSLSKYLSRLNKDEADEVIREIESHIYDVLESSDEEGNAQEILEGFGSARDLAASYVDHIIEGTPPPTGFKAIQQVKKGATKGLFYSTAVFGLGVAIFLILVSILKLFAPDQVGAWSAAGGNSVTISIGGADQHAGEEVMGFWIVPIFMGLGLAVLYLTKRLLSILKDKL